MNLQNEKQHVCIAVQSVSYNNTRNWLKNRVLSEVVFMVPTNYKIKIVVR